MTNLVEDIQNKDITGATQTVVARLRRQVLSSDSLLFPFINKMKITSGRTLYPYIDIVSEADSRFTIGSIEMAKTNGFDIAEVTNETREDTNDSIDMDAAIQNCLDIRMVKKIESKLVEALVADTNIRTAMTLDWSGIKTGLEALGSDVFSIVGNIYVGVNLSTYLNIVQDSEFINAMKHLKDKLRLVVVGGFNDTQMVVLHDHGVAGGLRAKKLELDPVPALDRVDYVAPYTYAFGWDPKYVKFTTT